LRRGGAVIGLDAGDDGPSLIKQGEDIGIVPGHVFGLDMVDLFVITYIGVESSDHRPLIPIVHNDIG
jgi:hypothetical protein